jgi:hypothetical protein
MGWWSAAVRAHNHDLPGSVRLLFLFKISKASIRVAACVLHLCSCDMCWHLPCVCAQQGCTPGTGCCPYGRILASGTSCRKAETECADEAQCDGVSPMCPGNPVKTMGTICRQPRQPCEQPATCDGEYLKYHEGVDAVAGALQGTVLANFAVQLTCSKPGLMKMMHTSAKSSTWFVCSLTARRVVRRVPSQLSHVERDTLHKRSSRQYVRTRR